MTSQLDHSTQTSQDAPSEIVFHESLSQDFYITAKKVSTPNGRVTGYLLTKKDGKPTDRCL